MDIPVIYEDDDLMVINKPAGMVVFPEGQTKDNTVIDYLINKYPLLKTAGVPPRYGIIHRLDKDTSGILLVARDNSSLEYYQKQFKDRMVEKKYRALVYGIINEQCGIIDTLINRSLKNRLKQGIYPLDDPEASRPGSRQATTEWRLIESFGDKEDGYSLLELFPKTGRKHQIRAHLAYIGHPIINDKLYSFKDQEMIPELGRQFLHAHSLKINLRDGNNKEFFAELPQDLQETLKLLKTQKYANR